MAYLKYLRSREWRSMREHARFLAALGRASTR
jgi:hypothetical protein